MTRDQAKATLLVALRAAPSGGLSGGALSRACGLSVGNTRRALADLVLEGRVLREGENRESRYSADPSNPSSEPVQPVQDGPVQDPSNPSSGPDQPGRVIKGRKDLDPSNPSSLEGEGGGEEEDLSNKKTGTSPSWRPLGPGPVQPVQVADPSNPSSAEPEDADLEGRIDSLEETVLRLAAQLQAIAGRAKVAVVEGKPLSDADLEECRVAAAEAVRQEKRRRRAADEDADVIDDRYGGYSAAIYNRLKLSLLQGDRTEVEGLLADEAWRIAGPERAQAVKDAAAACEVATMVHRDAEGALGTPEANAKTLERYRGFIEDPSFVPSWFKLDHAKQEVARLEELESSPAKRAAAEGRLSEAASALQDARANLREAEGRARREGFTLNGWRAEQAASRA